MSDLVPRLRIQDTSDGHRDIALERDAVCFGRSGECDIVLRSPGVSRQHGRLTRDPQGSWWVEDLNSRNGTCVNGRSITRQALVDGDVLQIGGAVLTFCLAPGQSVAGSCGFTIADAGAPPGIVLERSPGRVEGMDSRRLAALYEVGRQLLSKRSISSLMETAAGAMLAGLEARAVVVAAMDDPDRPPRETVVRPSDLAAHSLVLSRTILRRSMAGKQAVLIGDTGQDAGLKSAPSIVRGGIQSAMCVPMMVDGRVIGCIYVDSSGDSERYDERDLDFTCAVGAMVGAAIENSRLQQADIEHARMEAELSGARRVQKALLPPSWPHLIGWVVHGYQCPCREVGGDYCDVIVAQDGQVWMIVADVCGKGAPAAILASGIYATVHAVVDRVDSPRALLSRINEVLVRREVDLSFVTCLVCVLDPATGRVRISSAGHPAPLFVGANGRASSVGIAKGMVLGIQPHADCADSEWVFPGPGALLLCSDGMTEVFNPAHQEFGEEGLLRAIVGATWESARDLVEVAEAAVRELRGSDEATDDMTLLVCRKVAG